MTYYAIFKKCEVGTCYQIPEFVVESKEVAEDICRRFSLFYYEECDTEDTKEK